SSARSGAFGAPQTLGFQSCEKDVLVPLALERRRRQVDGLAEPAADDESFERIPRNGPEFVRRAVAVACGPGRAVLTVENDHQRLACPRGLNRLAKDVGRTFERAAQRDAARCARGHHQTRFFERTSPALGTNGAAAGEVELEQKSIPAAP